MGRFDLVGMAAAGALVLGVAGWAASPSPEEQEDDVGGHEEPRVDRSDEEWRAILSGEKYRILRERGTERAFTGEYYETKTPGVYVCAGCGAELFSSDDKYDSGSGWPSYFQPVSAEAVTTHTDRSLYVPRTEIRCGHCDGHLGHVFPDGPPPTGLRYCVNSAALELRPTAAAP